MIQTFSTKQKFRQLLVILLPIFVTQVALQCMSFFDTVMSGNFNKENLAGVAVAVSYWVPVYTGFSGIFLAVTPIVAQYIGAKERHRMASSVTQAAYLSAIVGVGIVIVGFFAVNPLIDSMNLEAEVARVAKSFLHAIGIGVVPLFIYTVIRATIDGLGMTRVTMFITLLSFPVNVLLNYLLIFGKFGFPRLGGVGAGVATASTYFIILAVAIVFVKRNSVMQELGLFQKFESIKFSEWKEVLRIGLPIGLSIFFEVSVFSIVTLLMSGYDTITIASHQSALNFASLLYMLPLSIAMSLTILIGFEVGAKRYEDAKKYARLGIITAIGLACVCAVFLVMFRTNVAGLYTIDPTVKTMTETFLIYAIFFQLSDAIAAPIQGTLRGYKDVNSVFIIALCSYWVIGLPVGFVLARFTSLEAYGFWIGLITGLALGAIALFIRLGMIERKVKRGIVPSN
ncbi:MATE family efflux transporter [Paenibacillus selenitireducens]|uniref:Probable multidrug resistance protein NorM n=1 Tax=Paenibacillus selenitireducens TaxID=1324314 RepID=A0A1T2XCZ1_9BACL|nr:MATE family efflux transporter [Paenibacillus selenitireducens]OPA77759.1 MATE family efflux transporter [Paenibacillus selenitireducens]